MGKGERPYMSDGGKFFFLSGVTGGYGRGGFTGNWSLVLSVVGLGEVEVSDSRMKEELMRHLGIEVVQFEPNTSYIDVAAEVKLGPIGATSEDPDAAGNADAGPDKTPDDENWMLQHKTWQGLPG